MVDAPIVLFVNGTLMRGLGLHANLSGAVFLGEATTASRYRLYSIDDRHPGMFEVEQNGVAIAGELYQVPPDVWQRVQAGEPPGLYLGRVQLADGREVDGVLYPRELAESEHRDISAFGGWRAYMSSRGGGGSTTEHLEHKKDVTETKPPPECYGRGLATNSHESMLRSGRGE